MTAASNIVLAHRVARRFQAKGKGLSLVPEFKKALEDYKKGDWAPMKAFLVKVRGLILPDGGTAPAWFGALGTAKRNAIRALHRDSHALADNLDPSISKTGPETWISYMVPRLEEWGKKLRTLEIASQADDAEVAIERNGFTVIPMAGVTKAEIDGSLEALDAAIAAVRSKFPKVLYGKVFLSTHLGGKTAARYMYNDDTVHLSVKARKRFDDVYSLIHELGHRYDHKFLKDELRKRFWALSTQKVYEKLQFDAKLREQVADEAVSLAKARAQGRPVPNPSPELVAWLKSPDGPNNPRELTTKFLNLQITEKELHDGMKGTKDSEVTTEKVLHGPLSVTTYGATSPTENFAEAFAHFILGKSMPPEFVEILSEAK